MIVPEGGFGRTLDAMFDFHARHGIRAIKSTGRRDENGRDIIWWCFADPKLAEAFAKEVQGAAEAKTLSQRMRIIKLIGTT